MDIKNTFICLSAAAIVTLAVTENIKKIPEELEDVEAVLGSTIDEFHARCIRAVRNFGYPEAGDFSDLIVVRNEILKNNGFSPDSVTFWCREPTHGIPQVCLQLAGKKEKKCF